MVRSMTWAAVAGWVWCVSAIFASAAPPFSSILPETTKAYFSIPNLPETDTAFGQSPLGKLLDDPAMKPFLDDVEKQLTQKKARLEAATGFALSDLEGIVSGEASLSFIRSSDGVPVITLLADVSGHPEKVDSLIKKAEQKLIAGGGKPSAQTVQGTPMTIVQMPPLRAGQGPHTAVFFVRDNVLVATTNVLVAGELLNNIITPPKTSLESIPSYAAVMDRAKSAGANLPTHISWWVDPIGLADAIRAADPNPPQGKDILKMLKTEGIGAVQGAGGLVSFATGPYGLLHRTFVFAPPPFERGTRMLKFPNGNDFAPPAWVPRDVNTYTSLYFDTHNAFDNFGTVFDAMFGEGEEGVWEDVLDSIKNDPNGPQIDLREDLIANLTHRCTILTDNTTPIGPFSQRRLVAIECKNAPAVADAIRKALDGDPNIEVHEFQGQPIFEIIPEQPALPTAETAAAAKAPNGAVTVAHGYLLIATRMDLLQEIITTPAAPNPLAQDTEFKRIFDEVAKLSGGQTSGQGFARNGEKVQVTYEMFRQNRLPETDTPMAQILNAIFNADDGTLPRPARLDGTKLPEFSLVRKYVGVGGTFVTSEPNGWYISGFTNDPNSPRAAEARRP